MNIVAATDQMVLFNKVLTMYSTIFFKFITSIKF